METATVQALALPMSLFSSAGYVGPSWTDRVVSRISSFLASNPSPTAPNSNHQTSVSVTISAEGWRPLASRKLVVKNYGVEWKGPIKCGGYGNELLLGHELSG